jgi:hypothetical protein
VTTTHLSTVLPRLADDMLFVTTSTNRRANLDLYWWEPFPDTEFLWKNLYKRVSICNAVLHNVEEFSAEPGDGDRCIKGEAHFLRAAFYYYLVNFYAKPFASTAATDPGVPLKLSPDVEDKRYTRHTLQACYEQILRDLETAATCLEGIHSGVYRAGEMAARLLLGRVHLYMGNWEAAVSASDVVIGSAVHTLLDYDAIWKGDPSLLADVVHADSPEVIFSNGTNAYNSMEYYYPNTYYCRANDEIAALYDDDDLRRRYFFRGQTATGTLAPRKKYSTSGKEVSDYFILRLPEAYLNKAEALVMLGRDAEAIATLRALLEKRYIAGTLPAVNLAGEALLNFIRDHRRMEFTFEGQRYFDLRRYAVSAKWPYQKEIRHPYYSPGGTEISGERVLGKYDDEPEYYVIPIPESEIMNNAGALIQNDTRAQKLPL